jgi:hypothetical protein
VGFLLAWLIDAALCQCECPGIGQRAQFSIVINSCSGSKFRVSSVMAPLCLGGPASEPATVVTCNRPKQWLPELSCTHS